MRLATIVMEGRSRAGLVRGAMILPLTTGDPELDSLRRIAAAGRPGLERIRAWAEDQPETAWQSIDAVRLGPAVPDPRAIFTIGVNYGGTPGERRPERPLVFGKLPGSVAAHGSIVTWDRSLTPNVDPEAELAVVVGPATASDWLDPSMARVFGYTCLNDISSRDSWLDGDQWLLGKSMAGFCPVGPWVVTADELDPSSLRLGCTINGVPIQDGCTRDMTFSIQEVIAYLDRHVTLHPGDLIATGTPARLPGPLGPDRHLEPGDAVTVWIERLGELTTTIA